MKPNLFNYATSELSQDAVLCWLAAWADPEAAMHDPLLHELGVQFLSAAFAACDKKLPAPLHKVEIKKQYKNIDVLVVINSSIALCIEDKAGSVEHSGQLGRYVDILRQDGYAIDAIVPVYIQTYNQSNYSGVKEAGYGRLSRQDLLEMLGHYMEQGGSNSIATDFHAYLVELDRWIRSFRDSPVKDWDGGAWQGFFTELQMVLGKGEWNYVPNAAGGFWAFHWAWHGDGESSQYLQLAEGRLTFRIEVYGDSDRRELRTKWFERVVEVGDELKVPFRKPLRFGLGNTMAVAELDGDYRVQTSAGFLDLEATLKRIRMAESVMDLAAQHCEAA